VDSFFFIMNEIPIAAQQHLVLQEWFYAMMLDG